MQCENGVMVCDYKTLFALIATIAAYNYCTLSLATHVNTFVEIIF